MPVLLLPAALLALLLVGLPPLIHWLTRRRSVPRSFPALAFLAQADAGRSRRRRLRELLVLALRCLVLLLAVLALCGPLWQGALGGAAARPAVVVLDASASMRQGGDGVAVWERARALAGRLLDEAGARPMALLIAGPPLLAGLAPDRDHGPERALLAEAVAGHGDGAPGAAVARAVEWLPEGGDCYLVTDLARGSISGIDVSALPPGVRLHLVDAGGGGDNVAITALTMEPGVAIAGRPLQLAARVVNYGATPRRVGLRLALGGRAELQDLDLAPGASTVVPLSHLPESSGHLAVVAELVHRGSGDALAADDRREGAIAVRPGLGVLLASDADPGDPAGPLRPLLAALAAAGLDCRRGDGAGLGELPGSGGPDLVVSAGLGRVDQAMAAGLRRHLQAGGRWFQIVASDADAELVETLAIEPPMRLGERIDVSDQERGRMAIAQARLDHPLLEAFLGREALLRQVGAWRYRLTPAGQAADATVLWTWGDGSLALVERPVGAGRWWLCNCSTAAADGDLAIGEALPVLCSRLPAVLVPARRPGLAEPVGTLVVTSGDLQGSDGSHLPRRADGVRLDRPGLFREAGGRLIAAAVPALESDLRRIDPAVVGLGVTAGEDLLADHRRTPLWPWLLALALLVLGLESSLAGGLGRQPGTGGAAER